MRRAHTPLQAARLIFKQSRTRGRGDGRRAVEVLLAGRTLDALDVEELEVLARGYNWWGKDAEALAAIRLALARTTDATPLLAAAQVYVWNAHSSREDFLAECDRLIAEGLGPAAFWHLAKADHLIMAATGEEELEDFEWSPGLEIPHPELLEPAADELRQALAAQPNLAELGWEWVGDWNERFAAVIGDPRFADLRLQS